MNIPHSPCSKTTPRSTFATTTPRGLRATTGRRARAPRAVPCMAANTAPTPSTLDAKRHREALWEQVKQTRHRDLPAHRERYCQLGHDEFASIVSE